MTLPMGRVGDADGVEKMQSAGGARVVRDYRRVFCPGKVINICARAGAYEAVRIENVADIFSAK